MLKESPWKAEVAATEGWQTKGPCFVEKQDWDVMKQIKIFFSSLCFKFYLNDKDDASLLLRNHWSIRWLAEKGLDWTPGELQNLGCDVETTRTCIAEARSADLLVMLLPSLGFILLIFEVIASGVYFLNCSPRHSSSARQCQRYIWHYWLD